MKRWKAAGLGLVVAGVGLILGSSRQRRSQRPAWPDEQARMEFGGEFEVDAAPLLVVLGAFDDVNLVAGEGPRVRVRDLDAPSGGGGVFLRRSDDGSRVNLNVPPRRRIEVAVPHATAVRLQLAKSKVIVTGLDDIDVLSAKGSIVLRDVGGTIRIRSAKEPIEIDLSHERETRSVDVQIAKARFSLCVPAARGGKYRIESVKTSVTAPASVENGIPIVVRAARAEIAIRAA